ncbi:MAG: signal recognition particle-docking protein FtsY [Actinomycetota bacterium]
MDSTQLLLIVAAIIVVSALVGFSVRARRRSDRWEELELPVREQADQRLAEPEPEPEPEPVPEPERTLPRPRPTPPNAVPDPAAQPAGSRLARGLAKTRTALGRSLSIVTRKERLDEEDWEDMEAALISADVGMKATMKIMDSVRAAKPTPLTLSEALKKELLAILGDGDRSLRTKKDGETSVWLVTGVNGVGKTTSIAKMANLAKSQGHSVVVAAADTFRAAAIEQLGTWADRVGVHMVRHAPGADPSAVVFDAVAHAKAKGIGLVIVDTAGRLHTKSNLMDELKKIQRIADQQSGGVSEVLLVIDATVGQNGIAQAKTFQEAIGVTGLILAKLDGSAKGGIALAVQEELGIPVKYVGVGEGLEDLEPFDPEQFVEALVGSN